MKIAIGCDHGALELKNTVKAHLEKRGFAVGDFGTYTAPSCGYRDLAAAAARAVSDIWSAKMTRRHNDTNMMALGAGVIGPSLALEIVDVWLDTEFSAEARHQRRIDKVMALEK